MNELVKYHEADREQKNKAARLAMSLIVAGKRNNEIIASTEASCGIVLTQTNVNGLRKRDDVAAAIASNNTEALQTGIATKSKRIAILEEGIELLHNTFVYKDQMDGKMKLRTMGDGIQGRDAVAAIKTMADIVKTAEEVMGGRSAGGNGGVNVQINNGAQVANFGSLIGVGSDSDVLTMLRNATAALEAKSDDDSLLEDEVIDVQFSEDENE